MDGSQQHKIALLYRGAMEQPTSQASKEKENRYRRDHRKCQRWISACWQDSVPQNKTFRAITGVKYNQNKVH